MTRLRIGVIGCGEVTQIIHLPALQHLAELFEVTALCDISARVMEGLAPRLGEPKCYLEYTRLVQDPEVDAVLIANPHVFHAEAAIAAMEAGKHVFIEKPMCITLAEADALAEAEQRTGRTVQIGYMRRYAGAFLEAVELVRRKRKKVKFARVHDFIGANALIVADTSAVIRDRDVAVAAKAPMQQLVRQRIGEAIGVKMGPLAKSYALLLGLNSHDISAMRDLFGRPRRVLHAAGREGGRCISATFDYGDFVCDFATGVDKIPRYDTFLEVYCDDMVIRVDYDTPYVRNLPARLTVTSAHGKGGVAHTGSYPSRLDTFVVEWQAFHTSVTSGTSPRTSIADAREDLEIFAEVMDALKADAASTRQHAGAGAAAQAGSN
ncbi:MAG TPA: Gfo/Idh/MocA family oxidoreductase [Devosiaceae bacterium]|nr:Gfo/Idh/MocA family oxidoreductase [Devosiaceae bacterium]